jgi:hypothetical protein
MLKTVPISVSHPDPHAYDVTGFKLAISNNIDGPYTVMDTVYTYNRSHIAPGDPEPGFVINFEIDVNYGQQLDRFLRAHAMDSSLQLSEPGPAIALSILETFVGPTINLV